MKNTHYLIACILLLLSAAGCGGNSSVTGQVSYADGTPLDHGIVFFETSSLIAKGTIQKDGTYTVFAGEKKGVPQGTYRVSIDGFQPTVEPAPVGPDGRPRGNARIIPPVIPIASKHLSAETSGLVCEVKGRTKFDITVEHP